jgi:ribosome-binding ATPase YchF (GTP1/OBG family)
MDRYLNEPFFKLHFFSLFCSSTRKCAGKIHSDFEAGFIKAEHWTVGDFIATNGAMKKTLKSGDYVLKYGDCFEFKVKT